MIPSVYTYQDPIKQTTFFRGYVKIYTKNKPEIIIKTCLDVHNNRASAEKDAKKMIKTLKNEP